MPDPNQAARSPDDTTQSNNVSKFGFRRYYISHNPTSGQLRSTCSTSGLPISCQVSRRLDGMENATLGRKGLLKSERWQCKRGALAFRTHCGKFIFVSSSRKRASERMESNLGSTRSQYRQLRFRYALSSQSKARSLSPNCA